MDLATDLGMDSLQIAELISFVGQNYNVEDLHPEDFETVQNVLEIAEGARASERPVIQSDILPRWPHRRKSAGAFFDHGPNHSGSVFKIMRCDGRFSCMRG